MLKCLELPKKIIDLGGQYQYFSWVLKSALRRVVYCEFKSLDIGFRPRTPLNIGMRGFLA